MKKFSFLYILLMLCFAISTFGQADNITSGFYLKFGPVFPLDKYRAGTVVDMHNVNYTPADYTLNYLPARIGGTLDMGYLIYLGPSFVNGLLRAGIDATFISFWFNSSNPAVSANKYKYYYYFGGQKFGPLFTINPIDKLMIDLSYKLNVNVGYHYGGWEDQGLANAQYSKFGINLVYQEVSVGIRYRLIAFSFLYNFGKMKFDNMSSSRQDQVVETNTIRILIGFKF